MIILDKTKLISILNKIQGITSRNTPVAGTRNVLFSAKQGSQVLNVSATDLETGYRGTMMFSDKFEGQLALPAKKLLEIVKNLPGEKVTFQILENRWVKIIAQEQPESYPIEFTIVGDNPDNVPDFVIPDNKQTLKIKSSALTVMIRNAMCVLGESNDTRAHINGALLEYDRKSGRLILTSVDGARMIYCGITVPGVPDVENIRAIISKRALKDLLKILPEENHDLNLAVKGNAFYCELDNDIMTTRLLEGEFPNPGTILHQSFQYQLHLNCDDLKDTLNRMALLTSDDYQSTRLNIENNQIVFITVNPEIGESREKIVGDFSIEQPIELIINPKMLLSLLPVIDTSQIRIQITENYQKDAIRLTRPTGEEKENFYPQDLLAFIMPMRM